MLSTLLLVVVVAIEKAPRIDGHAISDGRSLDLDVSERQVYR